MGVSIEAATGAARSPDTLFVGASGLTRAPPQTHFHELAELIYELDIAFVDRHECDLFERILPVDRLRSLALRGQHRAKLRDELFQTFLSPVGLHALDITSKPRTRQACFMEVSHV